MERLAILGNGFDLQAGLASKYSDFLNTFKADKTSNFWIYTLKKADETGLIGDDWNDVEGVIKNMLLTYSEDLLAKLMIDDIENQINIFSEISENTPDQCERIATGEQVDNMVITRDLIMSSSFKNSWLHQGNQLDEKQRFMFGLSNFLAQKKSNVTQNILKCVSQADRIGLGIKVGRVTYTHLMDDAKSVFTKFLEDELLDFEKEFVSYLKATVNKNDDYELKSKELFTKILTTFIEEKVYILSFNYTDSLRKCSIFNKTMILNNVHGTLSENNIILGIDFMDNFDSEIVPTGLIPFTKTFRKMMVKSPAEWKLPKKPTYITVYGHSLSSADYSYFQSIFDYVDLYGSNVVLEFLFSLYDIREDQTKDDRLKEQQKEQSENVYGLINTYGKTLTNKDQGKNLLHKLLLENRLKIREV